jgi:hypothetical protein
MDKFPGKLKAANTLNTEKIIHEKKAEFDQVS